MFTCELAWTLPPPINTLILLAYVPLASIFTFCAWRSISVDRLWNSLFSVSRSPVKVAEADCVARVFKRSSILEMLFMPPSTICNVLTPSLALRTPWVSSATSLRNLLATAKPAASSPEELMR